MTENERKFKKRIQLIVASTMSFFFCLIIVLSVQLAVRANQNSIEKRLNAARAELQQQIENEENLFNYYLSQKFIEEYAAKLGYGKDGSISFES